MSDAEYWRERAQEARAQSDARRDVEGKLALLHIAATYDHFADAAERRDTRHMALRNALVGGGGPGYR
jgi:hypothetical protein